MGQTGGGFRTWWRALYGSDDKLNDTHLMRMAGRFSRRLRAWAKENKVPAKLAAEKDRRSNPTHESRLTQSGAPPSPR
jgi:hypothetical protein